MAYRESQSALSVRGEWAHLVLIPDTVIPPQGDQCFPEGLVCESEDQGIKAAVKALEDVIQQLQRRQRPLDRAITLFHVLDDDERLRRYL